MRRALSFYAVNAPGRPGHNPHMQRHHLLPCQVLGIGAFNGLVASLGAERIGFHDFRRNGLLLPATESAAQRAMLPLHRGPHRRYSELVVERIGQIEATWQRRRASNADLAIREALMRLDLLQRALRRRLLDPRRSGAMMLNRRDPALDFSHLDAMADMLWGDTGAWGN